MHASVVVTFTHMVTYDLDLSPLMLKTYSAMHRLPQDLRSTDIREQFKRRLKDWHLSVSKAGGTSDRR